jgi:hypothetical protein
MECQEGAGDNPIDNAEHTETERHHGYQTIGEWGGDIVTCGTQQNGMGNDCQQQNSYYTYQQGTPSYQQGTTLPITTGRGMGKESTAPHAPKGYGEKKKP